MSIYFILAMQFSSQLSYNFHPKQSYITISTREQVIHVVDTHLFI